MYDNRKYVNVNSFIRTFSRTSEVPKLVWTQTWRNDIINMQINMWRHLPVGNPEHCLQANTNSPNNPTVDVRGQQEMNFFTGGSVIMEWTMDLYFGQKQQV